MNLDCYNNMSTSPLTLTHNVVKDTIYDVV